jgi:hypothetical protein
MREIVASDAIVMLARADEMADKISSG